jgi:hypothetical protein
MAGAFITVKDAASSLGDILPDMPGWLGAVADKAEILVNPIGELSEQINELDQSINPEAVGKLGESITGFTKATEDSTEVVEDNSKALRDQAAALEEAEARQRGAQSASLAYRQQVADTTAAVREATLVQLDSKRTDEERAQAARDAEAAVLEQADAAVKYAEEQAAANGETFSAQVKTALYIDELYRLAATLGGPARDEILAHIARLQGIPSSISTSISIGRAPTIAVSGYRASGGPVSAGGAYVVGENGPELLQMGSSGGNVIPNGAIGASPTYNFTINNANDPDAVVRAIRQFVKNNGPIQGIT